MKTDRRRTNLKLIVVDKDKKDFQPGEAYYSEDEQMLHYGCPGCGKESTLRIEDPKNTEMASWQLADGSLDDLENISLTPTISNVDCCHWNGHLTNGVFVSNL